MRVGEFNGQSAAVLPDVELLERNNRRLKGLFGVLFKDRGIGYDERARLGAGRSVEFEPSREFLERRDVVRGRKVDCKDVSGVGQILFDDDPFRLIAGRLQFAGDARDRMSVGVQELAFVAPRAERSGGIRLAAGIPAEKDVGGFRIGRVAHEERVGPDVVVIVHLVIVAPFKRGGEIAPGRARIGPADHHAGVRELGANRELKRLRFARGLRERNFGVESERGKVHWIAESEIAPQTGGFERLVAVPFEPAEISDVRRARFRGHGAVGEDGVVPFVQFKIRRVIEYGAHFREPEQVEPAVGGDARQSAQNHIVADAVVPVAHSLGAVAVVGKSLHEVIFRKVIGAREKERALFPGIEYVERGRDRARMADGVPVARAAHPRHAVLLTVENRFPIGR